MIIPMFNKVLEECSGLLNETSMRGLTGNGGTSKGWDVRARALFSSDRLIAGSRIR